MEGNRQSKQPKLCVSAAHPHSPLSWRASLLFRDSFRHSLVPVTLRIMPSSHKKRNSAIDAVLKWARKGLALSQEVVPLPAYSLIADVLLQLIDHIQVRSYFFI